MKTKEQLIRLIDELKHENDHQETFRKIRERNNAAITVLEWIINN